MEPAAPHTHAASLAPVEDPACVWVGRTIADKYVLRERIGTGSMGSVYRARHTALGRDVALKLMAPELAHDRGFVARFRREAQAASRLTHPSSVSTTDFGEEPDGLLYLVMEYVRGQSLESMLERGEALSEPRIVNILSQVLSAVGAAHDAGIVHRDLKPANVLVVQTTDDDGYPVERVKVCDFGVAALRDRADLITTGRHMAMREGPSADITMAGAVVGTPAYMAPEQAGGGTPDPRTDLYALGVVLFELLTGRLPICADTPEETMARQIDSLPPSPRQFVDCSPALAEVCLRAMAKPLADRFESARAMRAALRAALDAPAATATLQSASPSESLAGVVAASAPPLPAPRRLRQRWPLAATTLVLGVVACTTWLWRERPASAVAKPAAAPHASVAPMLSATPMLSTTALAAPAASAVPAPAAAASAAYTERNARVRMVVSSVSGTTVPLMRAMVSRLDLDGCYRKVLRTLGRPEAGRGAVTMYLDGDGNVKSAQIRPPPALGDAASCIHTKLRRLKAPEAPKSGSALATLALTFEP